MLYKIDYFKEQMKNLQYGTLQFQIISFESL